MAIYHRYRVWQRAHGLTLDIYRATTGFPNDERFGLTAQIRRAATSISSNIAEGLGRSADKDRSRFLDFAVGSANELEYHLTLGGELGYIDGPTHDELTAAVILIRKMLIALRSKMRSGVK